MKKINFLDCRIEYEVRRLLGRETGDITENDVLSIECIGLMEMKNGTDDTVYVCKPEMGYLTDISDITHFINLRRLYLSVRGKDLSQLSRLKKLEQLVLDCGTDADISVLAELPELRELSIQFNVCEVLPDMGFLGSLTKLRVLCLYHFYGSLDLGYLDGLRGIQSLSVNAYKLYNARVLNGLCGLRSLHFSAREYDVIPDLRNFPMLEKLSFSVDALSDIGTVRGLQNLTYLSVSRGKELDFTPISTLTRLKSLSVFADSAKNIESISEITGLKSLHLAGFPVENINWISSLGKLENLMLVNCGIEDIGSLYGLTSLEALSLIRNRITDIRSLGGLKELRTLDLQYNRIEDISALSSLEKLEVLDLTCNRITDISALGKLPLLYDVTLKKNNICDYSPVWELKRRADKKFTLICDMDEVPLAADRIKKDMALKYKYTEIPKSKGYELRRKFTDSFVDTANWQYEELIKDVKAEDIIENDKDYMVSYLWCCLRKDIRRRLVFEKAAELLKTMDGEVYVMWDIRPKEVIGPNGIPHRKYAPYTYFDSDTVLKLGVKELYGIVLHDYSCKVREQFLGEDIYVFDDTFKWYIAFTHEYDEDDITMCITNIECGNRSDNLGRAEN